MAKSNAMNFNEKGILTKKKKTVFIPKWDDKGKVVISIGKGKTVRCHDSWAGQRVRVHLVPVQQRPSIREQTKEWIKERYKKELREKEEWLEIEQFYGHLLRYTRKKLLDGVEK